MGTPELLKSVKTYMVVEGLLAVLLGLVILLWPGLTIATIVIFIGVWGVVEGLVLFFKGAFAHKGDTDRALSVVMGILSVLFGVLVLNVPVAFAAFGLALIAALIGVRGVYDIVSSFTLEDTMGHKVLLFIAGVIALLFSVFIFMNPAVGARTLVFFLAIMMMISGGAVLVAGASLKVK